MYKWCTDPLCQSNASGEPKLCARQRTEGWYLWSAGYVVGSADASVCAQAKDAAGAVQDKAGDVYNQAKDTVAGTVRRLPGSMPVDLK